MIDLYIRGRNPLVGGETYRRATQEQIDEAAGVTGLLTQIEGLNLRVRASEAINEGFVKEVAELREQRDALLKAAKAIVSDGVMFWDGVGECSECVFCHANDYKGEFKHDNDCPYTLIQEALCDKAKGEG
jgi:hypothetical protein